MNTQRRSQTLNYENPQIIEIDLAPQGVLCTSATGEDPKPMGMRMGNYGIDDEDGM